jgi:diguanylate cyclase (GGDEF)-like protein/PAS domain S-box-containing protein
VRAAARDDRIKWFIPDRAWGRSGQVTVSTRPPATPALDYRALFSLSPTAYAVLTPDLVIAEANPAYAALVGRNRDELVGRPFEAVIAAVEDRTVGGLELLRTALEHTLTTGETTRLPLLRVGLVDACRGRQERHWSVVNTATAETVGPRRLLLHQVDDVTDFVRDRAGDGSGGDGSGGDGSAGDTRGGWNQRMRAVEAMLRERMHPDHGALRSAVPAAAETPEAVPADAGPVVVGPGDPVPVVVGPGDAVPVDTVAAAAEPLPGVPSALGASERHAHAVLDTAVDAILTIDDRGTIQSANRATEEMFGYRQQDLVGQNIRMLMPDPYRRHHDAHLERFRRTGERRIIGSGREVAGQRRSGEVFPVEVAVSEVGSDPPLFTGVLRDITDRKRLESQLVHQSLHDPLTGLANRALLIQRLDHAAARLARRPGLLALLFIDLDRFKLVNDTLGHDAGDELLKESALRLRDAVRPEDLVARLGGDEFVVLCEDLNEVADAEALATRLVRTLNVPVRLRGREIFVSASVGVVTDDGHRTATEILGDADSAMYRAKEAGRGRYSLLDEKTRASANDRLQLGSDLHHAIEREETRACYQPLVDLRTGAVVAAEALLRWEHPRRGTLAPHAFLDLATELGLIADLDSWMMLTSCHQAAEWTAKLRRPVGVWVNLSSSSLADRRLPHTVTHALEESGLEPPLLTLEITEGGLMQDAADTIRALTTLRGLGVRLAVDDFGTGYSSLSYLQRFPVHSLKVDRSFVECLDQEPEVAMDSAALIAAIVNLASALGMQTVAEGIETPEQLTAVTALGCDVGQGYFLGRPTRQENIPRAMRSGVMLTPSTDNPLPQQRLPSR